MGDDGIIHCSPSSLLRGCWSQGFRSETHPRHPNGVRKIASLIPQCARCRATVSHSQTPRKPAEKAETDSCFLGPTPGLSLQKCVGCVSVRVESRRGTRVHCLVLPTLHPWESREPKGVGQVKPGQSIPCQGAGEALCFSASCPLHKCNFPECQRKALQITHCVCL